MPPPELRSCDPAPSRFGLRSVIASVPPTRHFTASRAPTLPGFAVF